jgi:hypothetical protein
VRLVIANPVQAGALPADDSARFAPGSMVAGPQPAGVSLARCSAFDSPRSSVLCRWLPIVHPPLAHPNVPLRCCGQHPLGTRHCCSETSDGRGPRQPPLAAGRATKDRSPGMNWVCVRKGKRRSPRGTSPWRGSGRRRARVELGDAAAALGERARRKRGGCRSRSGREGARWPERFTSPAALRGSEPT